MSNENAALKLMIPPPDALLRIAQKGPVSRWLEGWTSVALARVLSFLAGPVR